MKYDSSMKIYNPDILRNLYAMCGEDKDAAKLAKEASPVLLREYLKKAYGKSYRSHAGNGAHYSCTPTKGVDIIFNIALSNDGDKKLTLSWSQTANFIRKCIDEGTWVDKTPLPKESTENQPSCPAEDPAEADKPKPTYFDILLEHYPNFDEDVFDEFVISECTCDYFDNNKEEKCYNGNHPISCDECWKDECKYPWRLTSDGEANIIHYLTDLNENVNSAALPNPSVSVNTEETTALFDYSELDNDTAQNLRKCENVIRQKTAGYFTLLGEKFKEAQSLLANHSSGTFEKWYTALGFKRQTVYNLIQRYDFLSSPTLEGREDTFEALPLTLSYEVSKPDAPKELIEKVIDGDITTNAEYIKLKKELERTKEECHMIDANSAAKDKEYKQQLDNAKKRAENAEAQKEKFKKSNEEVYNRWVEERGRVVDLTRLHLFGDKDDEAAPGTPTNRLPSYTEMCRYASSDKAVSALLNTERYQSAVEAFGAQASPDIENWMALLEVSSTTGFPTKTTDNVIIILENDPLLKDKIVYEEFSNRVYAIGALPWESDPTQRIWTDNDDSGLRHYLEKVYHITGEKRIFDACSLSCHKHSFNAVKSYLSALPAWDGVSRLDTLFCDYLGAEDNEYVRAAARKSLTAAVARVMHPGVKYDTMPILAGRQGLGKSTLLRMLGGQWFSDSLAAFEGKEACEMIQGVWINEVGELNGLNRAETNAVKQFLSKVEDIFREPYGRRTTAYPRRCVFFGTTNEAEFLRDKTGNRRFWPIDCGLKPAIKSVFNDLPGEVSQIWAEALVAWQLGEPLYLEGEALRIAEKAQEEHSEQNTKEGIIREFVSREVLPDWDKRTIRQRQIYWQTDFEKEGVEHVPREKICAAEIWCECFGSDIKFMKRTDTLEINAVLTKLPEWGKSSGAMRFGAEYGVQKGFKRKKEL